MKNPWAASMGFLFDSSIKKNIVYAYIRLQEVAMKLYPDWQACFLEEGSKTDFFKAQVPGNAGLDYAKAHHYPDYSFSDNYKHFKWMEEKEWLYQTVIPKLIPGKNLFFVSMGIDYEFDILLNGKKIFYQEGMFTPVELDLRGAAEGDVFEVLIKKVPKRADAPKDTNREADRFTKPAVSYGWDWHPRLIPFGIWDDTYFEFKDETHIKDIDITYTLNEALTEAHVTARVELSKESGYTFKIFDADHREQRNPVENVKLWWPNGHGEPYLYQWEVTVLETGETKSGKIAFRKIELADNIGHDKFTYMPRDCSMPPFTLRINHKRIFAKGTNWVNPEIFTGTITEETYRPLIEKAAECNFNILRSWGGAIVNKQSFFDLCDEKGLMVWQEFPLACNNYEGEPYLKVLDRESRSIIKRYKNHVTMWCGGNELFNNWSGMNEQSLALRLLDKNCYELDRDKPFIKTSPLMNVGHGHYVFRYSEDTDVFQAMQKASRIAYVEFGLSSLAPYGRLKEIIPEDELFPIRPTKSWVAHHAFHAWDNRGWLFPETIQHYFGDVDTLEALISCYDWLQCEGYKAIYEEARRQSPYCSMALNWCYNEPWATAANNSLLSYPCIPKPAFYAVKAACRPVLASARIPKFEYKQGETFSAEIWLLNDTGTIVESGAVQAYLLIGDKKITLPTWEYPESDANVKGSTVAYALSDVQEGAFTLVLDAGAYSSEYKLKVAR